MESANVRIDEKFRIQERIVDYNLDDDITKTRNDGIFLEMNSEGEPRQEKSLKPLVEPRVEIATPTSGKNMKRSTHPNKSLKAKTKV